MDCIVAMLVDKKKENFAHIVCIKMAVNSPRRKILLLLSTNMTAMTLHGILQYDVMQNGEEKMTNTFSERNKSAFMRRTGTPTD